MDRVRVDTDTMAPTLVKGDRLFVAPRRNAPIRRGELVVYKLWETRYVKRVVGFRVTRCNVLLPGCCRSMGGRRASPTRFTLTRATSKTGDSTGSARTRCRRTA